MTHAGLGVVRPSAMLRASPLALYAAAACGVANTGAEVSDDCASFSFERCPVGTAPRVGAEASAYCAGKLEVDVRDQRGDLVGTCQSAGTCEVFCEVLPDRCPCGAESITRDSIACRTACGESTSGADSDLETGEPPTGATGGSSGGEAGDSASGTGGEVQGSSSSGAESPASPTEWSCDFEEGACGFEPDGDDGCLGTAPGVDGGLALRFGTGAACAANVVLDEALCPDGGPLGVAFTIFADGAWSEGTQWLSVGIGDGTTATTQHWYFSDAAVHHAYLPPGQWSAVLYTLDGASGTASLYVGDDLVGVEAVESELAGSCISSIRLFTPEVVARVDALWIGALAGTDGE